MQNNALKNDVLHFKHLPAYAKFLLEHKLEEFTAMMLLTSREVKLPILKFLDHLPAQQLMELSVQNSRELLDYFSSNRIREFIDLSLKRWLENELPIIQRGDIATRDISGVSFIRRKTFRNFLPAYSSDLQTYILVMEEVDRFTIELEEVCYNTLFDLKQKKINEHHYLLEKINNTSPGIIYVLDLLTMKEVYSSHKRERLLGYSDEEIKAMGGNIHLEILHPEDAAKVANNYQQLAALADGEIFTNEYRARHKDGHYLWFRVYETVFKRSAKGHPVEVIGIAVDITKEKEISNKLNEGEQLLAEAQEIAGLGSFDWDLVNGNSYLSPQMYKIFETETQRVSFSEILQYVHPGDRKRLNDAIDKALKGERDYECEYRYIKHNREKVLWSRGIVSFENGKPLHMKGTVMDVTQRHHMLQRLERSEELHKQAQALTHLGNWSWFIRDNKIQWSDEMYRIYGLLPQAEEITFDRFISMVHPENREKRLAEIQRALETLTADDYIMRIVNDDGTVKVLEGRGELLLDEEGKPFKLVGTCQDVTQQYLLNQKIAENETTFRELVNNAPDAIIVIDFDSNILLWNPKAEMIFGWTSEEVIGKQLSETIIPKQHIASHHDGMKRLHETGEIRVLNKPIEITAVNKKGKEFYVSLSISRSVQAGQPVFVSFIRDISKEKKAEMEIAVQRNELAQKNIELERSNQQLSSFNYIASHDLQEPLRKIRIYSNRIIEKNPSLPKDTRDYLDRMIVSASHMQNLIDDLLTFSRTTTTDHAYEKTDMNDILKVVIESIKENLEEKKAVITAAQLPVVKVIPFQFKQLFENMLGNAIKYAKQDVPLHILIDADKIAGEDYSALGGISGQSYHRITITDNGIGFDKRYAEKIFEPFQRLHGKGEYSGTGIGLAICKKIVENHKGFITASGKEGEGSVFTFFIPAES